MEDNKLRKGGIGKILYRVFNSIFYFLPILLSNIRFRRILLLPLYAKKQRDIGQQAKKIVAIIKHLKKEISSRRSFRFNSSFRMFCV